MDTAIAFRVFDRTLIGDKCWEWQAAVTAAGYGELMISRKMWAAHRAAWTAWNGPIPDGLWVLHRCDNRRCVRPGHLFLGTHADNMRDMESKGRGSNQNVAKTHCPQGHPYSGDNLIITTLGYRACRACMQERGQRWSHANRWKGGIRPELRTHCPRGHPYDEANTVRTAKGERRCLICKRDQLRQSRSRKAGESD